jgi:hypothetical protein
MCEAFNAVLQTLKYKVDMRTAAYIVAIGRSRRSPPARHTFAMVYHENTKNHEDHEE